ncbi:hypothetical protein TTHERM_000466140 (macronuclear) [Tetrahymena thermophila SB210]|uniref:Uncharacterized protein n=1 Tax=Tetrahymena thermophila (strain SB210) TaxID=312017 RepID=W7WY12_TETTS|nr:hypothetical protein TTHERM_000466140 [Tetrahymena thermophila SB210]EWS71750.1 hypothetical protein TTHERM_000466140 [Tetrahymena thermophila SB210]|eukprot:XP_012655703.1 hypothetical protein TTHERM_000466140 [Tetrahymena thermophila SB210]
MQRKSFNHKKYKVQLYKILLSLIQKKVDSPPWGSNPRPQDQESCALPTELGGQFSQFSDYKKHLLCEQVNKSYFNKSLYFIPQIARRGARTHDHKIKSLALYRLSQAGNSINFRITRSIYLVGMSQESSLNYENSTNSKNK